MVPVIRTVIMFIMYEFIVAKNETINSLIL